MTYDRYGDGFDSASAWLDGTGAPGGWPAGMVAGAADDAGDLALGELDPGELDGGGLDDGADELLETGVLEGLAADAAAVEAHVEAETHQQLDTMTDFRVDMMMLEMEHNANMMAISGIGGYHDSNYNGTIDYSDMGCTNNWGTIR